MSQSLQFHIDEQDDGSRVDDFCASRLGNLSRMRIGNLIEAGACLVNGAVGRAGHRLAAGDLVQLAFDEGAPTAMSPDPIPLEIAYEDDEIVVVVKPAGMLVHPTIGVKTGTLANAMAYHLNKSTIERAGDLTWDRTRPACSESGVEVKHAGRVRSQDEAAMMDPPPMVRPGLVHRLDRATSGLMVVAKTPRALSTLSRHFKRRLIEKRYLALVWGAVEADEGSISAAIGRDPDAQPRWRVTESGKPSETRFNVLERQRKTTLLEMEPITGRTNQLRIHCAYIGHPIVGDQVHGELRLQMSDCESEIRDSQLQMRLCLHASRLAFHHPANGQWLEFSSNPPDDFVAILEGLRN